MFTEHDVIEYSHETDYFYFSDYKNRGSNRDRTEFIDMMKLLLEMSENEEAIN